MQNMRVAYVVSGRMSSIRNMCLLHRAQGKFVEETVFYSTNFEVSLEFCNAAAHHNKNRLAGLTNPVLSRLSRREENFLWLSCYKSLSNGMWIFFPSSLSNAILISPLWITNIYCFYTYQIKTSVVSHFGNHRSDYLFHFFPICTQKKGLWFATHLILSQQQEFSAMQSSFQSLITEGVWVQGCQYVSL